MDYLEPKEMVGLVVVLTGHGKGKTSSALGMVVRAVGHGLRVCLISFMKGDLYAGEYDGLKMLPGVEHHLTGKGFCGIQGNPIPTPSTGATPRMPLCWRRRNSSPAHSIF